jgi:hypothetical protein
MKHTLYILLLFITSLQVKAQLPEDAIRMSWNIPSGTARQQAIGGAMGSLGGEISSLFVNPAGLGFYKTSEIVLTPGFSMAKSKSSYRDTDAQSDNQTRFNLGTTGFVGGWTDRYSKWTSKAFAIGVNRIANFNSTVYYKGSNNFSSFSEQFAEELSASGVNIDDFQNSNLSYGTKLAIYTWLIDVDTINGVPQVVGLPEYLDAVNQENRITSTGGITEVAIGFANNMDDKIYIGGSIGVPIVNYVRTSTFSETDPSTNANNYFKFSNYTEEFSSKGVGVNARLGLIFKPQPSWRVGLAIHTPTLYGLKDKYSASMVTDVENYPPRNQNGTGPITSSSNSPATYKYDLVSPWRFLVSGSYVLQEVQDIKQQQGFITADIEYVTYGSSRFSAAEDNGDDNFFTEMNSVVKTAYKGAINFRVGGELKFNTLMTRLGFAYYGNPYEEKELKGNKMNLSGGLGYRNKGVFLDLTYVQSLNKDVHFPYRLSDKANTFADIKDRSGSVILTVGFKM